MATVPKQLDESPVGWIGRRWTALCDWLNQISPLFVLSAYVVISAVLWVGAATVALYLGTVLPGMAGGWSSSRKVDRDEPDRGKATETGIYRNNT